jgi:hypothetical protein
MLEIFGCLFICEMLWLIGLVSGWWLMSRWAGDGKVANANGAFFTVSIGIIWSVLWTIIALITVGIKLLGE